MLRVCAPPRMSLSRQASVYTVYTLYRPCKSAANHGCVPCCVFDCRTRLEYVPGCLYICVPCALTCLCLCAYVQLSNETLVLDSPPQVGWWDSEQSAWSTEGVRWGGGHTHVGQRCTAFLVVTCSAALDRTLLLKRLFKATLISVHAPCHINHIRSPACHQPTGIMYTITHFDILRACFL